MKNKKIVAMQDEQDQYIYFEQVSEEDALKQLEEEKEHRQQQVEEQQKVEEFLQEKKRKEQKIQTVHGTTQHINLIDKIVRNRIYDSQYYKQHCFGLNASTIIDKAVEIEAVGGCYGGASRPTRFLCLLFKMLTIEIEKEIILAFIHNENYKYVTALGAFYWRLTASAKDVYEVLEPLLNDYRKLRKRKLNGEYEILYMDQFIEELLTTDSFCSVTLPFLPKRRVLEDRGDLDGPRLSLLDDVDDETIAKELNEPLPSQEAPPSAKKSFALKFKKPSKRDRDEFESSSSSSSNQPSGNEISMSLEQTNALRKQLGLAPLK